MHRLSDGIDVDAMAGLWARLEALRDSLSRLRAKLRTQEEPIWRRQEAEMQRDLDILESEWLLACLAEAAAQPNT
jgi:hypothetical protein